MNPLFVFRFHDAPQQFQDLSTNGGDEDWVIICDKSNEHLGSWVSERLEISDGARYEIHTEARWLGKQIDVLNYIVFITSHA